MEPVVAIVVAGGLGTRMRSKLAKGLHRVAGRTMVEHVSEAVRRAGIDRQVVIIGYQADRVREVLGDSVEYALQPEQKGTGHAVNCARPLLAGFNGNVLVVFADNPLLSPETLREVIRAHQTSGAQATVLTAEVPDPGRLGRVLRDGEGNFLGTVETADATGEQRKIKEVVSGVFCFQGPALFDALARIRPNNAQGEYYLTDVFKILMADGGRVIAHRAADCREILAADNRAQLSVVEKTLRGRIRERLMLEGVTLVDPDSTYIDADCQIGRDTVVHPQTFIEAGTVIGEDCEIGPASRLRGCRLGNGVRVQFSVATQAVIEDGVEVGPYAHLRPGTVLRAGAKVGDFVEIKQSEVGAGTKINHLAYIGDAEIGAGTNVGAGVITVNYDGKKKHKTIVGQRVMVGCNANLVAPVSLGDDSYIAAGSTITRNVPEGALAVARERQVNKPGWKDRRGQ
ncbi:MAG: bifunctional UDP-N-acetylglucosamine diphosphorylase/glucosamine-1-phosphate N-acetyltransferase GlmU [Bacillota bacterium]